MPEEHIYLKYQRGEKLFKHTWNENKKKKIFLQVSNVKCKYTTILIICSTSQPLFHIVKLDENKQSKINLIQFSTITGKYMINKSAILRLILWLSHVTNIRLWHLLNSP